jgi:predicted dehydrogenase
MPTNRIRAALVGTGHRGLNMWGRGLLAGYGEFVEMVALCDSNPMRAERVRDTMGIASPVFTDFDALMRTQRPNLVIVCTRDADHDQYIVAALESGADVITEKPMATTVEKCRRIMEAEQRTGRRVDVAFNYRYSPLAIRIKELLRAGRIGTVTSVDFHWYLDTRHGADYYRRWHALVKNSGSLWVHKATHHFDLLNWYLESDPEDVAAFSSLRHYGRNGPFRGERCRTCPHTGKCKFYFDIRTDPTLEMLYEAPSRVDGYVRDACVFREEIDIPDTMTAAIRYASGAQVAYSVSTYMPIEGFHLAFNGTGGRMEIRQYDGQPWTVPPADEIVLMPNFGAAERIWVPYQPGGHFGGDDGLRSMLFRPDMVDPLGQRAGARAGAMSVLCGVAALESSRAKRTVSVSELWGGALPS